jgi:hypothetical protein
MDLLIIQEKPLGRNGYGRRSRWARQARDVTTKAAALISAGSPGSGTAVVSRAVAELMVRRVPSKVQV